VQSLFSLETLIQLRDFLWSGPLLFCLVAVGVYQTFQLRGLQFRQLGRALGLVFMPKKLKKTSGTPGDISSFQSLMTSLAGAIGTGNIAGIATAVALGGFGSLFWMWLIAFLGMATAYSETLLSIKYRIQNEKGTMAGGPMYTLANGLKSPKLAAAYALFGALAAIGTGNLVQANSVAHAVTTAFTPINHTTVGLIMMGFVAAVFLGGIRSIGRVAEWLVPFKATLYVGVSLYILGFHYDHLGDALWLIVSSAFTGQAAMGGFIGSSMIMAMQFGVSKGVFSNEAGLGSLAIAAASAKTTKPAEQGLFAISGVFISTMLICTITGLVLAVTNVLGTVDANGQVLTGSAMVMAAFDSVYPGLQYVVVMGLIMFAFTTILAWGYYGEKCTEYLFGLKAAYTYRWLYTGMVFIGALLKLELVWALADVANGFMAIPNLIAIVGLCAVVKHETKLYFDASVIEKDKTPTPDLELPEST
jgi:alanine or glycine:cation symporter, AGCS family